MRVVFLYEGECGSIKQYTQEIANYFNNGREGVSSQHSAVKTGAEYLGLGSGIHLWADNQPKSIDAGNFLAVDSNPQLDTRSGRYRRKRAVPT